MGSSEVCIPSRENIASLLPLPDAFLEFLKDNDLDSSIYAAAGSIPRYIRLKPQCESQRTEIESELKCKLEKIDWLPGFYAIPPSTQIASAKAYRSGKDNYSNLKMLKAAVLHKIYGMDAASGAAVMALNVISGDHVLDLCSAPGAKLCMLADLLGNSGSITGVDVARHRLAACRTMLQKYEVGDRCRLFVADGTTFSLLPAISDTGASDGKVIADTFGEWTSKRSWKDRKNAAKGKTATGAYALLASSEPDLIFYGRDSGVVGMERNILFHVVDSTKYLTSGYDKVLVDAECTHDGSIKHVQKFEFWGWPTFQRRVLEAKRTEKLTCLQLALLTNGFRLLKVGGFLVYSTCSLTVSQNENVVEQFLSRNPSAELIHVDAADMWCCRSGRIPRTLRFDPITSQTSGLFIAKFTKRAA